MNIDYAQEENNYPKAITISVSILVGFLLLCYFAIMSVNEQPEVGTGGLIVNYGTSDVGMGNDYMSIEEPSVDPNANLAPPDKVVPNTQPTENVSAESTEKNVYTQDAEDAVSIKTKEKRSENAPTQSTQIKESKPAINQNALYKGKKNAGSGAGDGEGAAPGNQGKPQGDPLANNYDGTGSGNGGVALSLANRRFRNTPNIKDDGQLSGKVAVEIQVDKSGNVISAKAGARGTTLSDAGLWKKCETAVLASSFNTLESAPDVQRGVVFFNFKVK